MGGWEYGARRTVLFTKGKCPRTHFLSEAGRVLFDLDYNIQMIIPGFDR